MTKHSAIRVFLASLIGLGCLATASIAKAQECMIGEVRYFAGNFAPRSWLFANGQLLAISSNEALFSILGTTYGGDGRTTFALPDLRGRVPMGAGNGPGLTPRPLGQKGGQESVTLTSATMPNHSHQLFGTEDGGNSETPANGLDADLSRTDQYNTSAQATPSAMSQAAIGGAGGNQPHQNLQPYETLNPIICQFGYYPSRN